MTSSSHSPHGHGSRPTIKYTAQDAFDGPPPQGAEAKMIVIQVLEGHLLVHMSLATLKSRHNACLRR